MPTYISVQLGSTSNLTGYSQIATQITCLTSVHRVLHHPLLQLGSQGLYQHHREGEEERA